MDKPAASLLHFIEKRKAWEYWNETRYNVLYYHIKTFFKKASLNDILSDSSDEVLDINSTSEEEECDESLCIFLEF